MYARNVDTGKWFNQNDSLRKDVYDNLKQDLDKIRLYSKCLSGATYLPIKSFDNIYDTLDIDEVGYYIDGAFAIPDRPSFGPTIPLNTSVEKKFYDKYLIEDGFTIKNLFTPNKLISDQMKNFISVEVATTDVIPDLNVELPNLIIDGVKLVEGNLVLVKNQGLEVAIPVTIDAEDYFTNTVPVATYSVLSDNVSTISYFYNDNTNGIYEYTENKLLKTNLLDSYEDVYRFSVVVNSGVANRELQYHLKRLKNGYYPVSSEGDNLFFEVKENWILRNRVDYNNIFDLNYYDVLYHGSQSFYDDFDMKTYSIVDKTIAVGEFGVIINNQDFLSISATHSISNLINNKYKVNLRSICEVSAYYWICGDEGTLLRARKIDFTIRRVTLEETVNFMSVSFFDDLNGMVVGKFNTIYWTGDGGFSWEKISIPDFDGYSYNKVVFYSLTQVFIGGETGVFIELTRTTGGWQSYKRKVSKIIDSQDEFVLVDDINDMFKTSWVNLYGTYSNSITSSDFRESLQFNWQLSQGMFLKISLSSKYFGNSVFENSSFYMAAAVEPSIYQGINFTTAPLSNPVPPYTDYDFYKDGSNKKYDLYVPMPSDPVTGNLLQGTYSFRANLYYNFNGASSSIDTNFSLKKVSFNLITKDGNILLISGNNDTVICYDIDNIIFDKSNFIYFTPTQSVSDVKTISRQPNGRDVFIGGDKIYKFDFAQFLNINSITNASVGTFSTVVDYYVNKLFLSKENVYLAGNNSLFRYGSYTGSNYPLLDPTFDDKLRSRLLFLDYDVASKLNFFDDSGEYRLASPVSFNVRDFVGNFTIDSYANEYNWLDYYKDAEKTFKYYSSMNDLNKVEFSTTFQHSSNSSFTVSSSLISDSLASILPFAPNINSPTASRFTVGSPLSLPISSSFTRVYIYKYLVVIQSDISSSIGDVLRLESDVIDVNLVVNRIENSGSLRFLYCYSDFNSNIIRNLATSTKPITIQNLNRYDDFDELSVRFEKHPVSIGYKLVKDGFDVRVEQRFNNKTAYYNMQSTITLGTFSSDMRYEESFLNFGYSPTYNVLDYLNKIDSGYFNTNSIFYIMPKYENLPGNAGGSFTQSNIYVDLLEGQQSGTFSYYNYGTNKILFGSDFEFQWKSLLIHTFIDLDLNFTNGSSFTNERLLIIDKYYDDATLGYVIEFHTKIKTPDQLSVDVLSFNFKSRNSLEQISADLQLLNNIQRTRTTKSVQNIQTFSGLENELMRKFPTDSYFKVFASDYRIRKLISAIIYTDYKSEIAMNILNLEEERKYNFSNAVRTSNFNYGAEKVGLYINGDFELEVGDLISVKFTGGSQSSEYLNPHYSGLHTILEVGRGYVITSIDWGVNSNISPDPGVIVFFKRDPFLNFQPVDLIKLGVDGNVKRAIEIRPENLQLKLKTYNLIDLDLNRYRYQFVDGLSLEEVSNSFPWFLEAEVTNAIIGRDQNGLVWYSGDWLCGRWFGGTWYSGRWVFGDWYGGTWNSLSTDYKVIKVDVDRSYSPTDLSIWYGGRWFAGTWNNGTWYNGRRYAGDWNNGIWFNGIWNDGNWKNGRFKGGVWVLGKWESGIFNTDAKPSYWLDGEFKSGDFENGVWYNGQFGNLNNTPARFGIKSSNSRNSIWHSGKWISGEFHSIMNKDGNDNNLVSEIHKYSIWRTGIWLKGDFWGGIAYNIDFRSGTWHGGILEEIQVIGVDRILPANQSTNSIILNGDFRFNIGNEIWIIDDERDFPYSPLGSNDSPKKYRINKIEELDNKQTRVFLNYNFSALGVSPIIAGTAYTNYETGLRVVSYFKNAKWETGIWTNGIFEDGQFDAGIWYNGLFNGGWGN